MQFLYRHLVSSDFIINVKTVLAPFFEGDKIPHDLAS